MEKSTAGNKAEEDSQEAIGKQSELPVEWELGQSAHT